MTSRAAPGDTSRFRVRTAYGGSETGALVLGLALCLCLEAGVGKACEGLGVPSDAASCAHGGNGKCQRTHAIRVLGLKRPDAPATLDVETLDKDFPVASSFRAAKWQEEDAQTFSGVPVAALVARYAKPGTKRVRVVATNNYAATLDESDWTKAGALMAYRTDGALIPTRNRGTFRIVFDYGAHPNLVKSVVDMKWVWQVESLTFLP